MTHGIKEMLKGKFILVEGISGSGKSTLAKEWLVPFLESHGKKVLLDFEPTRGIIGKSIRTLIEGGRLESEQLQGFSMLIDTLITRMSAYPRIPLWQKKLADSYIEHIRKISEKISLDELLTEEERQLLFLADRYYDLHDTIIPTLTKGEWVVLDRYDLSNLAYGAAHGLKMHDLYKWHKAVLREQYLVPDVTIFVDASPETAMARLEASGKTIDRYETLDSLCAIGSAYERAIRMRILRDRALVLRIDGEQPQSEVYTLVKRGLRTSKIV